MKRAWLISFLLAIASATGASAADGVFDVHLTEPREHFDLIAGSTVSIAWEASSQPADVEEWEAFLSINDGRTYPIRLTPHLDATIHRFTWTVPSFPGAEASLLLRFGDERHERRFPFPARMRIKGDISLDLFRYEALSAAVRHGTRQEDDHGELLAEWVEGSRDGFGLWRTVVCEASLAGQSELAVPSDEESLPAVTSQSKRLDPATLQSLTNDTVCRRGLRLTRQISPNHHTDLLALSRRLNI